MIAGMRIRPLKAERQRGTASPSGITWRSVWTAARPRITILSSFKSAMAVADHATDPPRMD